MMVKTFSVGSKNRAKIRAVENVVNRRYEDFEIKSHSVKTGISDMPTSFEEARRGAHNRAVNAEKKGDSDLGIGIEAYVENGKYLTIWSAVSRNGDIIGEGGSGRIKLPEKIHSRVPEEELGDVIEELVDGEDIREKEGVVGVLTDGKVTRTEFTETSLGFAFSQLEGYDI